MPIESAAEPELNAAAGARLRWVEWVLYSVFLAGLFFFFQPTFLHDAFQYYAYLSSVVLDGDLDLNNQLYLHNYFRTYNPFPWHSARYIGTAIMETPFFLVAHGIALGLQRAGFDVAANGYSLVYGVVVGLATPWFGMCGLIMCYRLARTVCGQSAGLLATLGIWLSSALAFFMFFWVGWPHPFALFWTAFFLLLWQRTRKHREPKQWILLGVLLGMAGLTQPPAVLVALFPIGEGVRLGISCRRQRTWQNLFSFVRGLLLCALVSVLVFSPQLSLWRGTSGHWFSAPYADVGDSFNWARPRLVAMLFDTARHGLFAWTPLLLPALLGQFLLFRRDRLLAWTTLLFSALSLYCYACWSIWWCGVGFSNRFFIPLTPVFVLGLAALLNALHHKHIPWKWLSGALLLFVVWNTLMMTAYRGGTLPQGIPEPNRFLVEPLTQNNLWAALLSNPLHLLRSLFNDYLVNHTFFASRVRLALQTGRWADAVQISALFLLIATGMISGFRLFWKRLEQPKSIGWVGLAWIAAALVGVHGVIWAAAANTGAVSRIGRVPTDDRAAVAGAAPVVFETHCPEPVDDIHIISSLAYAHAIPQGAAVAEVTLEDAAGRCQTITMKAGVDTAEQSCLRLEDRHLMRHVYDKNRVVRTAVSRAYSDSYHELLQFCFSWHLPRPTRVNKLQVRFLYPYGQLYLADLFLESRRAGAARSSQTLDTTNAICLTASHAAAQTAQDAQGSIYAATPGGLAVYSSSGIPLRKYTRADGWPTHTLNALCLAPDGTLWVASTRGVIRLAGEEAQYFSTSNGLNDAMVNTVVYTDQFGLLAGTANGVNRYEHGRFVPLDDTHELARRKVYDIHEDKQGGVWLAKETGLSHFAPDGSLTVFRRELFGFKPESAPGGNEILSITTDEQQHPWVRTRAGLSWFDGSRWYNLPANRQDLPNQTTNTTAALQPFSNDLPDNTIDSFRMLADHRMAIQSATGQTVFDETRGETIPVKTNDSTGASGVAGVSVLSQTDRPWSAGDVELTCMAEGTQDGQYWIGTRHHGVWLRNANGWREVTLYGRRLPAGITALQPVGDRVLWVGTANEGAIRLEWEEAP
jgi:hypothetical protein